MRVLLILTAAALVLLAVLALTRSGDRPVLTQGTAPQKAPAAEQAAKPAAAIAPEPKAEEAPAPPPEPPIDPQVAEDAAAVGLTTREPARKAPVKAPGEQTAEKKQP